MKNNLRFAVPVLFAIQSLIFTAMAWIPSSAAPITRDHRPAAEIKGFWTATVKGDDLCFLFNGDQNNQEIAFNSCIAKREFGSVPTTKEGEFKLEREAGTFLWTGKFTGNEGKGEFTFTPDKEFIDYLDQHGVTGIDKENQFSFFLINLKRTYVSMLENNGFRAIPKTELIGACATEVDDAYIRMWKGNGYNSITLSQLTSAKSLDIRESDLNDLRAAGYNLSVEDLFSFKSQGIDSRYIDHITKLLQENINFPGPGQKLAAASLLTIRALGLNADYLQFIRQAGYTSIALDDLIAMKSLGVDMKFIKDLGELGYRNIPAGTLISLKGVHITPGYIAEMRKKGYNYQNLEEYIELKNSSR
jgi:hypothetical protein